MTEGEARTIYESFCAEKGRKPTSSSAKPEPDGSWRFVEMEGQGTNGIYEGVVVRTNGEAFSFGGALGKVFRNYPRLEAPRSEERSLGYRHVHFRMSFHHSAYSLFSLTSCGFKESI